jgi:heme/copper-type cytochrome/quinol oxidase subunit 1
MVGGSLMAYLGGVHFWWSKMTGRMYPATLSKLSAVTIFIGFNLTFFPQFLLGYLGMPRRYHAYPPEFQSLNVFSTAGATVLGARLCDAAAVLAVVTQIRSGGWQQSMGRDRVGMASPIAADYGELCRDAGHRP